jgi:VWFA-related protein
MRCAVILALVLPLAAQDSRFNVRSRLVLVPVTISDSNGRPVDGLEAADFRLLDNRWERKITVDTIATGVAPIALVIAVQSAGISTPVLEKVRKIGVMIQPLVTGVRGCAGVLSFSDKVAWLQDCTNDADAIQRALYRLKPGEHKQAVMLDAVNAAIEHLAKRPNARRVLLLISESRDRGSETDLKAVTKAAQSADVSIYAFTYSVLKTAFTSKAPLTREPHDKSPQTTPEQDGMHTANGAPPSKYNTVSPKLVPEGQSVDPFAILSEFGHMRNVNATQALAAATGGITFPFTSQQGLETAISRFGAELHSQYVLSFVPEGAAPGYHNLQVSLVRTGRFHIRARPGYWSTERSSDILPAGPPIAR